MATTSVPNVTPVGDRLRALFAHLGIRRAHLAAGFGADVLGLAANDPEVVASLTLVCPSRLLAEPLQPFADRLLLVHGDRGPSAGTVPRTAAVLPGSRTLTLVDYVDAAWSDVIADRLPEIRTALFDFLDDVHQRKPVEPVHLTESDGEVAGVSYRIAGSGPPLVILPQNLARSQWDPLLPALAERYCTIVLGGAFIGFPQSLEQRIRGAYRGVVRALFDAAAIQPGEAIVEVGCGSGAVARWLARWTDGANPIIAVDVNRYLLREAEVLTRAAGLGDQVAFRHGDAEALPLDSESFDVCLSYTVMEEVDADRMLAEMVRVTRPGGRVGVVVRATDMLPWVSVPLRPELQAMIAASSAGKVDLGCADASLYRRFAAAGLTGLRMGPRLAANQPEPGSDLLSAFTTRIMGCLPLEAADEFRSAVDQAVEDGTMIWAEAFHCAVGTKGPA